MGVAKALEISERRRQAVSLKLAGASWEDVARQCGYSDRGAACKDVSRALEASRADLGESINELRALELARYDRLQMALWPSATQGDLKAIETFLKISDRRANLLGLNAPIQHEVITVDAVTARIVALAEELDVPIPERLALPAGPGTGAALDAPGAGAVEG